MTHFCVQCMDEDPTGVSLEVYRCKTCGDTFCWHFMKTTRGDSICYVCGSEKKKKEGA